ncbi:hypothetical protein [Mucilaginibacter jinjuensis]|uniref:Uncharacterized protein n=1 Tax=Mucilaginibacter jinjuensis TaxID=1176721 RepID=A0ABY7TEQ0_9SPHI|nr:hypothetical protein [Mucilaginibacter jinjuensis]WCT14941.1 hypothetical protein PQO05_13440 [Mucilaginibacter jinjuensis]
MPFFIETGQSYAQAISSISKADSVNDNFDIKKYSFILPQPLPKGKYSQQIGIQYVVVPKDWTTEQITAPMFSYTGKYTLPYGFNLQASLATLFVSNRLNFGPFWNYSSGNLYFGAGYQVAYNLGWLKQFGFNTTLNIWEQQPSLTVGYSFKTMAVVLRGDMYLTSSLKETQAGHTISYPSFLNGYSVTGTIEQRLWKNHLMSFGFKFNYLKYHIIAWPAFPVNKYRYSVPEFDLGLSF